MQREKANTIRGGQRLWHCVVGLAGLASIAWMSGCSQTPHADLGRDQGIDLGRDQGILRDAPLADVTPADATVKPRTFYVGAAAIEVTPAETDLPVIINGFLLERTSTSVTTPIFARALVLDDGEKKLAIAVVDTLAMPRELIDDAKARASASTGIPVEHMMVGATHTHSAPSVMSVLGSGVDEKYARQLPKWIAEAIKQAADNLAPAQVGWTAVRAPKHTLCRRWIRRSDRLLPDPFGSRTVRANIHPGYQSPDVIGPSGPVDDWLSILAVRSPQGIPVAVLANYSMHFVGATPVSSDYFGYFVSEVTDNLAWAQEQGPASPVVMMSQGTSGDLHWMDYSQPQKTVAVTTYALELAQIFLNAYRRIEFHDWVPLAVAERKLALKRRLPSDERLAWADGVVAQMGATKPTTQAEVYALEQLHLKREPERELRIQAMRVGDLGITAIPVEAFGITGLKIKAQSPFPITFNLHLTNGEEGYIPPPEQHVLGGYTTWPARTAALEVGAEPQVVETVVSLLEQVSGQKRREPARAQSNYEHAVLDSAPLAFWPLDDMAGPRAIDKTSNGHHGEYEEGVVFYLPGPEISGLSADSYESRAAHFVSGRLKTAVSGLNGTYSIEMWIWNGLPNRVRPVTGYFFSRGKEKEPLSPGDHLGISGTSSVNLPGQLVFYNGDRKKQLLVGKTVLEPKTWHHIALVRDLTQVRVYLDGRPEPEISGEISVDYNSSETHLFFGGRSDGFAGLEGKMGAVSVHGRALSAEEIAAHYAAAGIGTQ